MPSHRHVLLFPGEHADLPGALRSLNVKSKTNPRLRTFLKDASKSVLDELSRVAGAERDAIGTFEDLVDLAERYAAQDQRSMVTEMTLLTTVQIGQLIITATDDPSIISSTTKEDVLSWGYGTGLIASTVAAAAHNVESLISLGCHGVCMALRLAMELQRTSKPIEDSDDSWAIEVSAFSTEDVIRHIEPINNELRPLQQAYIGQISTSSVVIQGPPSTLRAVSASPSFANTTATPLMTVQSLMHAAHLPSIDIEHVIGNISDLDHQRQRSGFYSGHESTASRVDGDLEHLLCTAITHVAHQQVVADDSIRAIAASLDRSSVSLSVLGSWDASFIKEIFEQQGHEVCFNNSTAPETSVDSIPSDAIAIVGMSGRFPQSDTLDELWELLENGRTTHQEIPSDRFAVDDFYDPSRATHNALLARHGCFIKKPGDFDHRLFNISPREALQMDPVQRMLLMTTYEALEMAGYAADGKSSPPRVATYFGQTVDDWKTINEQQGIDTHYLPGVNRGFAPGRLCHYFQWAGGFYSIDTGCSSSATGICLARDALLAGNCDAAVVGGGTLLTAPEWFAGLSQGGFLSPTGACKTYAENADGYCRGEGVGVVVLKRLSDAIRSKDNILAVVAGAARNTNAGEGSITHPGQNAQETLYRRVLRNAAVHPHEVDVVEMHGTGTQAGDKVETTAVRNVFASLSGPRRPAPLTVGAVKANLGHSEAAAGIVSLIKSVLILKHGKVPRQANQPIALNPHLFPLFGSDIQLANGQSWPRDESKPRYLFINNFDAAGGNVSMLLRDAPPTSSSSQQKTEISQARTQHIVVTSSRTDAARAVNKSRLRQFLVEHPQTRIEDLAYTTTARRMHQSLRDAYVVGSTAELLTELNKPINAASTSATGPASSTVFAFTGQGAQHVGMGGTFYRTSSTFKVLLDSYQEICNAQGIDCQFIDIINGSREPESSTLERDLQVATVALEIALANYWSTLGLEPTMLIGHSLGEYAALCIAGVLSVTDALALAFERASLIFTRCKPGESGMLAVSLPASTVQWRIRDSAATAGCEVTCVNGPASTVVGGPIAAISALEEYLKSEENVSCTRLRTQHAFHTRQMDGILGDLESHAKRAVFHPPKLPVASTLLGRIVKPGEVNVFNAEYLRRHTREPVAFVDAVRASEAEGMLNTQSFVVEIGPHPVCIGLMGATAQTMIPNRFPSLCRNKDDWVSMSQCLAGAYKAQLPISWAEVHKDQLDGLRLLSHLPTYAFDNKTFWHVYKSRVAENNKDATHSNRAKQLSTTSLHAVEEIRKEKGKLVATFTADLGDHRLAKAIGGHVVDGVAICPASIFMDMAYTAAAYLENESLGAAVSSASKHELTGLTMQSPLVLRPDVEDKRQIRVNGVLDESTNIVTVGFFSATPGAPESSTKEHGSCMVHLNSSDAAFHESWSRMQSLVSSRMRTLETSNRPKDVHTMDKGLFYKVFSEIVDYSTIYQAVEQASIAANFQDASLDLQVTADKDNGTFTCSPFAVDAVVHVAGFLLNADVKKPKQEVHIANHIESLRVFDESSLSGPCQAYATIREQDIRTGVSLCDVYVTDAKGTLVALCTGIRFKKLERDFFAMLTGSDRLVQAPKKMSPSPKRSRSGRESYASSSHSSDSSVTTTRRSSVSSASLSSMSDTVDLSMELLEAVASRSGVSLAEIRHSMDMTFDSMGIDSQMSIAILSDFQKSTALELPAAFFTNFPTPAAVEQELGNQESVKPVKSKRTTRETSPAAALPKSTQQQRNASRPSLKLFDLVADALGLEMNDLTPDTVFESVGMDSMLSIKIISAFRQATDIELPAAFFSEFATVQAARDELDTSLDTELSTDISSPSGQVGGPAIVAPIAQVSPRQQKIDSSVSRAVLIQGRSQSRETPMFFTTDGSGTVESYIHLRALPKGRRIYALESPFLQCPENFDLSIEEMATIFIRALRKIQPHGPYMIGGWSAGSMYAYEVAHRLAMSGETIAALTIIDMRAPSLIPTTIVTSDFVDKLGTFEGINRARDLPVDLSVKEKAHLMATCRALSKYDAPAFPASRKPQNVDVVWAKSGLDETPDAPVAAMGRPGLDIGKAMTDMTLPEFERYFKSWFHGRRAQFGMNGWETLLGDHIRVHTVDGDHFSMMAPPYASAVGSIVVDAVQRAVGDGQ